jgi:hypothetical protein
VSGRGEVDHRRSSVSLSTRSGRELPSVGRTRDPASDYDVGAQARGDDEIEQDHPHDAFPTPASSIPIPRTASRREPKAGPSGGSSACSGLRGGGPSREAWAVAIATKKPRMPELPSGRATSQPTHFGLVFALGKSPTEPTTVAGSRRNRRRSRCLRQREL